MTGDAARPAVAVIGLGNVLHGDDAVGPTVVRHLAARWEMPATVSVADLGTPGLDLHPHIGGVTSLIVVDTVRSDGPAGALRRYDKEQILRHPPPQRVSPHDPGLKETLLGLEFAGSAPADVVLLGVIPESTEQGIGLRGPVAASLDALERAVLDELRRLGVVPVRRDPALDPDLWWEQDVDVDLGAR